MKGTEAFTRIIQNYLNDEAVKDETIKAKLAMPKNCIENVVSYIINQVKNSGCCGITSSEIYSLALHFVLEDDLEPGTRLQCNIVVNEQVQLSQEEIEEAKQRAMLQVQREQMEKLRKPTTPKKVTAQPAQQTSLFDF
jgi:hypothetical protein